jgi:ligand-binding sensor protein
MVVLKVNEIDLSKLELGDLIDVNVLQNFLDNFAIGFNCAAVSVGRNGEEFTQPSYYRPFCANYIHASSTGDGRCATCHNEFGRKSIEQGRPYIGYCHAGLVDFAAPVIVKGEHIGTVLGGQILNKPAEETNIRKVAHEIGVDQDGLWDATKQIDIVPEKTIQAAAEVLNIVVNALALSGFKRIETDILSSNLADNFIQISKTIEHLAEDSQDVVKNQSDLLTEIHDIQGQINEITGVLKSITKIADQTKILGINASIEAARIGAAGKGFAVVASEIRNLSDTTKQTVGTVEDITDKVEKSIVSTMRSADQTMETITNQSSSMEELSATVQNAVSLAERLRDLFHIG